MANVITNILIFTGPQFRIHDLKAAVQDEKLGYGSIDFNKIIPTPPHISQENVSMEQLRNKDSNTWFHWNPANWGSRDNAYGYYRLLNRATPDTLLFEVGWTPPHKVIQKLSEMYPDLTIVHQWADDNVGYDCGEREYKAGAFTEVLLEPGSRLAYEYSAKIIGIDLAEDKQMYLTEDGSTYEYREIDEMEGMCQ